jgi:hypothetical protein
VRSVSLKVGAIAILGRTVKVIVSLDKLHELFLHISELVFWEFVFIWLDLRLLEETKEAQFVLQKE